MDVKLGLKEDGSVEAPRCAEVNIATIELPMMIRLQRRFTGNYHYLWLS